MTDTCDTPLASATESADPAIPAVPELPAERAMEDAARCRAVEDALFRRACGYKMAVRKTYKIKRIEYDSDTGKKILEQESLESGTEEEHVPADFRVCTYFLNNRDPERWREHPQATDMGDIAGLVDYPPMESLPKPWDELDRSDSEGDVP